MSRTPDAADGATTSIALRIPLLPRSIRWLVVLLVAATIAVFSIRSAPPGAGVSILDLAFSYFLHAAAYGGLALAIAYALATSPRRWTQRALAVVVLALGYGLAIELAQGTTADRTASTLDMVANAVGVLASLGWYAVERRAELVPLSDWL